MLIDLPLVIFESVNFVLTFFALCLEFEHPIRSIGQKFALGIKEGL